MLSLVRRCRSPSLSCLCSATTSGWSSPSSIRKERSGRPSPSTSKIRSAIGAISSGQCFIVKLPTNPDFFKNGPIPTSFCLFSFFSHYNFNTNWKKRRWCAQDSNLGSQDGRRRRNHRAMAATLGWALITILCVFTFPTSGNCSKTFCCTYIVLAWRKKLIPLKNCIQ